MRMHLTKFEHETIISLMTCQPHSYDVMNQASDDFQKLLVEHYNWPKNVMIHGLLMQGLWNVYCAGERRGIVRANDPFSALYPLPEDRELQAGK